MIGSKDGRHERLKLQPCSLCGGEREGYYRIQVRRLGHFNNMKTCRLCFHTSKAIDTPRKQEETQCRE